MSIVADGVDSRNTLNIINANGIEEFKLANQRIRGVVSIRIVTNGSQTITGGTLKLLSFDPITGLTYQIPAEYVVTNSNATTLTSNDGATTTQTAMQVSTIYRNAGGVNYAMGNNQQLQLQIFYFGIGARAALNYTASGGVTGAPQLTYVETGLTALG